MQQYYPSVVELFKIVKKKSSHQTKGSNDKLSLSQCEYNLQENLGSKMQFSVAEL